jgi:hypothetical protein
MASFGDLHLSAITWEQKRVLFIVKHTLNFVHSFLNN